MKALTMTSAALLLLSVLICTPAWSIDFKVHRYAAEQWDTNSYWLESDQGIVLIDAQLLRSDATLLAALIKSRGKPVKGILITHPHADHIGGLNTLRQKLGTFPVITTQKTANAFQHYHETAQAFGFGDDFDKQLIKADKIVQDKQTLTLAGIPFVIDDIGKGESENHVVFYQPDKNILFTGDSTMHGKHFYLGESASEKILAQHHYLQATYGDVKRMYPGHGDPATPKAILETEIEYIKYQRSLVQEALSSSANLNKEGSGLNHQATESIINAITHRYPSLGSYGLPVEEFLTWNIQGLVSELQAKNQ